MKKKKHFESPALSQVPSQPEPHRLDAIATRAYEIWEQSGRVHGNDRAHWEQAEKEYLAKQSANPGVDVPRVVPAPSEKQLIQVAPETPDSSGSRHAA